MKRIWLSLLGILLVAVASIYLTLYPDLSETSNPAVLRVGVLPDENAKNLHRRYDPLLDYLSARSGREFELVVPSDYRELVQLFSRDEIELAYFGGLTFVQAHLSSDAEPLVMRDVDTRFTSSFVVSSEDSAESLADLEGSSFAFGSRLSTSGHLMPRHFMQTEAQIVAEEYFSEVRYSGAHDKTAYLVRDGSVDLGAVNSEIIRQMHRDGRLKKDDIRVLWETPPYPDYVWAVHDHLDEDFKTQLRDAFLEISLGDPISRGILTGMGAGAFLPAGANEFLPLVAIADTLGLLEPGQP